MPDHVPNPLDVGRGGSPSESFDDLLSRESRMPPQDVCDLYPYLCPAIDTTPEERLLEIGPYSAADFDLLGSARSGLCSEPMDELTPDEARYTRGRVRAELHRVEAEGGEVQRRPSVRPGVRQSSRDVPFNCRDAGASGGIQSLN